jgi:predicted dienelactone hydrolase
MLPHPACTLRADLPGRSPSAFGLCCLALAVACSGGSEGESDKGAGDPGGDSGGAGPAANCTPVAPTVDLADGLAGHREDSVTHTPAWAETRTVPLHIWYPTQATTGEAVNYLDFMPDPDSLGGASVDLPADGCKLPLVLYSHGYQGWAGNETDVLRQFVRNGWIAAAPDHTGNTLTGNVEPVPVGFDLTRVADLQRVIDHLADLPEGDPLRGRIDTDHVLVLGHSYGGQTAWLLAEPDFDPALVDAECAGTEGGCTEAERAAFESPVSEPRVVSVAPLDGAANSLVSASGWARRTKPVLFMSRESDDAAEAYARAAGEGVIWMMLSGSCHESFTSTPVACDLSKEVSLPIVSEWLLAWGATTVQGQSGYADLLAGDRLVSELTVVTP